MKTFKKYMAALVLLMFSATLLPMFPASEAEAASIKTSMTEMYFADSSGRETTDVGEAIELVLVFSATSKSEKPKIQLDKRIEPLPLSLQPDGDKIERIVGTTVTMKPGLEDMTVRIRFINALTQSGDYQLPVRVGSSGTVINPENVQFLTLKPGPAVMINPQYATAEERNQPEHSGFSYDISSPKVKSDSEGNPISYGFKANVTLQLKDRYDNATSKLPEGKQLMIRFEPRHGRDIDDYEISALDEDQEITKNYQAITYIPKDKHSLGRIEFSVATTEPASSTFSEVPKLYAGFANVGNNFIDEKTEIVSAIGFIPYTLPRSGENTADTNYHPSLSVNGTIQTGSNNNQFVFTIDQLYPAAGKRLKLTLPSGYIAAETNKNYVYFDYDDIGKTRVIKLNAIPKKINTNQEPDAKSFKITIDPATKGEDVPAYEVFNLGLITYAAGIADSTKSKLALGNPKTARADNSSQIAATLAVNDVNGNPTQELADDYHLFIWCEREAGKVSEVDTIVKTADEDAVEIESTEGKDNGHKGVFEVVDFIPEDCEVPFGIVSTLEGNATVKAAIAPDAYSALLYRAKEDGLVSNTIKATFSPYADSATWLFNSVKVGSAKATEFVANDPHYQALRTKKSNGTDKFSVSAKLDSQEGKVKLSDEPIEITCAEDGISFASKTSEKINGGIKVLTDKSGNVKFDATSTKNGTFTVRVKSVNSTAEFDLKISFDDSGGTLIDSDLVDDSFEARLKTVSKIVIDNQSSMLLAAGDTLYVRFRMYDDAGKEITVQNDEEAKQAVRTLTLDSKPQGSDVEGGKDKDIKIEANDGGVFLSFIADKLGKYAITMTIPNGKSGKASFTVNQTERIVGLRLEYPELGLDLGSSSSKGQLVFIDASGVETVKPIPVGGIEVTASGRALERFDQATGVVKANKLDSSSGTVITVRAVDYSHRLEANHRFVIGHGLLGLEFSNTEGYVHQTQRVTARITDEANRSLPLGALSPSEGAQMTISVLSKPANAEVRTELENNGASFAQNGMNVLKVRSDRIGTVRLRIDIRAVDPNYSTKYPVYTFLSGIVDVKFEYPGILDSKPFYEGYSTGNTTLMYIGSNTYVNRGQISYMDAPPFIQNDRTFIPVRALGDALGASTYYNDSNQSVNISFGGDSVALQIGSPIISTRNGNVHSDVVPFIQDGRTYLPLRVVAEIFGCQVDAIYDEGSVIGVIFAQQ